MKKPSCCPSSRSLHPPPAAVAFVALAGARVQIFSDPSTQKAHLSVCFALAEKERFELSRRYNRPTPLAGAPLRPLEYFSVYSTQTAACSRLRPLYYTHFATACQAFFRFSLFLFAIFFSIGSPRLTRGRNRAIIFLSPSPVFSGEKKKAVPAVFRRARILSQAARNTASAAQPL